MDYKKAIKRGLKNGLTFQKMLSIAENSDKNTIELEKAIVKEYIKTI